MADDPTGAAVSGQSDSAPDPDEVLLQGEITYAQRAPNLLDRIEAAIRDGGPAADALLDRQSADEDMTEAEFDARPAAGQPVTVVGRDAVAAERARIAERIRAELVCCDVYDQDTGTDRAGRTHAICFWGEAAARLAEDGDQQDATEPPGRIEQAEQRGYQRAIETLRDDSRYQHWWTRLDEQDPAYGYWQRPARRHLANYLETLATYNVTASPITPAAVRDQQ